MSWKSSCSSSAFSVCLRGLGPGKERGENDHREERKHSWRRQSWKPVMRKGNMKAEIGGSNRSALRKERGGTNKKWSFLVCRFPRPGTLWLQPASVIACCPSQIVWVLLCHVDFWARWWEPGGWRLLQYWYLLFARDRVRCSCCAESFALLDLLRAFSQVKAVAYS